MTATNTTNKALSEPASGDLNWDVNLNANFTAIDKAFGSFVNIATTTGNYPLVTADLQNMCFKSNTSAFTGNVTYTIPNGIAGQWVVVNQSASSAFTLSVVCGASSILVGRGDVRSIYCDGTSVFYADTPATAGSDTQIIYNSSGIVTGSSNLTFNGAAVSVGGSTATTNASCASTTATVTFSNGQTIPVGSIVTITGVTPTGYNGSWVTIGTATLNQVQFTVPSTLGNQTVAGTLSYGNLNLGGNLIGGIASQALAAAGTNNSAVMTPLATAQAITALATAAVPSPIGVGQTWQDLTASRTYTTSYQNTTGRPISVNLSLDAGANRSVQVSVNNSTWITIGITAGGSKTPVSFIVPASWYYRINGSTTIDTWAELR